MADKPNILQPREPFLDGRGEPDRDGKIKPETMGVSRGWWRYLNDITNLSGRLLNPLVIGANSFFNATSITDGGTLEPANSPSRTLLGNSQGTEAPATPQTVAPSLSFENGTLAAANLAARTLAGNPLGVAAPVSEIFVGENLSLDGNILNATEGTATTAGSELAFTIRDERGEVDTLRRQVSNIETLTFMGMEHRNSGSILPLATLTSAATITPDFAISHNFVCTLTMNGTLAFPTNVAGGMEGNIEIVNGTTAAFTLSINSGYQKAGGGAITITPTAAARDVFELYVCNGGAVIATNPLLNIS
ncbi:MAG TPA: hypothetical protein VNU68_35100 [Verrucomicrobiae bacterium]|nr:hypothetical protein [Verrucomicrobiae bacterium]